MIKRIPRIDGPALTIKEYEDGIDIDVYEYFGLPSEGWIEHIPKGVSA